MDQVTIILVSLLASSSCAALGGTTAYCKKRKPSEGVFLGLGLGPLGLLIEFLMPEVKRPELDQPAWRSFHSLVKYQSMVGRSGSKGAA